jgi:hypothetical protein
VKKLVLIGMVLTMAGCTSFGTLGMVAKSTGDPGAILKNAQSYKELGPVEGTACRFAVLGLIPFGDATLSKAVDKALAKSGGDAIINVATSNSLYTIIPLYNIVIYTCTDVKGIAIKINDK